MPVFNFSTGIVQTNSSGQIIWRSDAHPHFLLPQSTWISASISLSFPDFSKGNLAYYQTYTYLGSFTAGSAMSFGTVVNQADVALSNVLLGTVPSGVNYLDVSVNLTRTNAPDAWLGQAVPVGGLSEGNQSDPEWGCVVLEGNHAYRRGMSIFLSGTSVYLGGKQSVAANASASSVLNGPGYKSDPQVWTSGPTVAWRGVATHGGDPTGWPTTIITADDNPATDINKQRGGSNQPSFSDPSDFTATYAGTATIRPGYIL